MYSSLHCTLFQLVYPIIPLSLCTQLGTPFRHQHFHKEKPVRQEGAPSVLGRLLPYCQGSSESRVPTSPSRAATPTQAGQGCPRAGQGCVPGQGRAVPALGCPRAGLSHLSSRRCTASQASRRLSSPYIRNRIRRQHARLLVSCFRRLGFDLPLNPRNQSHTGQEGSSKAGITSQK